MLKDARGEHTVSSEPLGVVEGFLVFRRLCLERAYPSSVLVVTPIPKGMEAARRDEVLSRYADRIRWFEEVASQRRSLDHRLGAEVIPFHGSREELERGLTRRAVEVLWLISEGLTNREIGERLYISEETVKAHIRGLLAALQVRSRAHAVAVGFRRGIIE